MRKISFSLVFTFPTQKLSFLSDYTPETNFKTKSAGSINITNSREIKLIHVNIILFLQHDPCYILLFLL